MERITALLAERTKVTVTVYEPGPFEALASANVDAQAIVVPPLSAEYPVSKNFQRFAARLHEFGHTQSERCGGVRHQPTTLTELGSAHCCLACEVNADNWALQAVPFNAAMWQELRRGLIWYRKRMTPELAVGTEADRLIGTRAEAEYRQRRVKAQLRHELVDAWLTEARLRRMER
jgi:hypothetical protein